MTQERRRSALALLPAAFLLAGLVACAPKEEKPAAAKSEPAAPAASEHAADHTGAAAATGPATTAPAGARIFFVEPAMGASVTSPVHIVFGAENFTIEPKGDGSVHPGAGHHHIGVDTQCLAPGTVIPSAAPWVHFGDGKSEIDVQLPPGEHHLVAQVGDGQHRTFDAPGLCAELHVNVTGSAPGSSGATASTGAAAATGSTASTGAPAKP